jgi:smad nuclear-interacting protein 1
MSGRSSQGQGHHGGYRSKGDESRKRPHPSNKDREDEDSKYGKKDNNGDGEEKVKVEKEKPNFGLSGKLTEETNTFRGVVIKYSEPPEARKPSKIRWRLYPFKGKEALEVMYIHRQSAYLLGKTNKEN